MFCWGWGGSSLAYVFLQAVPITLFALAPSLIAGWHRGSENQREKSERETEREIERETARDERQSQRQNERQSGTQIE